jgi:hypothetical protein
MAKVPRMTSVDDVVDGAESGAPADTLVDRGRIRITRGAPANSNPLVTPSANPDAAMMPMSDSLLTRPSPRPVGPPGTILVFDRSPLLRSANHRWWGFPGHSAPRDEPHRSSRRPVTSPRDLALHGDGVAEPAPVERRQGGDVAHAQQV